MNIRCSNPYHTDNTPSMTVYLDGAYCHSCGYLDRSKFDIEAPKREAEDIPKTLEYISTLDPQGVRGLTLPADSKGYYLVWPDKSFYKLRLWGGFIRYIGPKGHKAPLYIRQGKNSSTLLLIEGELNAESVYQAFRDYDYTPCIASPGSCNEFMRHMKDYLYYSRIFAILDKDAAGVAAGAELKRELTKRGIAVELIVVNPDYNEILEKQGKEALQQEVLKDLGVQGRVQIDR